MKIDSRRLGILLAIHRDGGVVAAADSLHMTPSAVSQQIHKLEQEVEAPVIDRTPFGSVLTPAGQILADLAELIESESAKAARALAGVAGQVTGSVVIGGFQTVIRNVLLPLLPHLAEELPGVDVSIREVVERQGVRELRSGVIDLLLLEQDFDQPAATPRGMRDVPYADEPWLLVQPGDEPRPTAISDLGSTTWLAVDPNAASAQATDRLLAALPDPQVSIHRYADYDVALEMIRAGLGSTVMPSLAVAGADLADVQVTRIPGLGVRHLSIRHRLTRGGLQPAHDVVMKMILDTAASLRQDHAGVIGQE